MNPAAEVLDEPTWFVSDVHIRFGDRDYLEPFLSFVRAAAGAVRRLYVVGDLFEFWIGDRQGRLPFYEPLFTELRLATRGGLRILIVQGNRDFLVGGCFAEAGCELIADELDFRIGGQSLHVSHGDQFCIHDLSYLRARRVMRSRAARLVASWLPASLGVLLAKNYRKISERKKRRMGERGMGPGRFHTIEDGIRREIEARGHDIVLCGHIHDFAEREIQVGGKPRRILTTGAWEDGPNFVEADHGDVRLRRFEPVATASRS